MILDQHKTQIAFVLTDVLHTVHGNFQLEQEHILIETATNAISGEVIVAAGSGHNGSAARDKRMTRDILQAQRFPAIRFAPSGYSGSIGLTGSSDVTVSGSFAIHSDAHNITIPMHYPNHRQTGKGRG